MSERLWEATIDSPAAREDLLDLRARVAKLGAAAIGLTDDDFERARARAEGRAPMSERPTDEELRRLLTKYGFQSDSSAVLAILDEKDALRARVAKLEEVLTAAYHALESYAHDNASTELAVSVAAHCKAALKDAPTS